MARLASMRNTRGDLSVPRGAPVRGALYDADAFGRFSESLARFLGTGKYLVGQTVIVIFWIILNSLAVRPPLGPVPVHPAQPGLLDPGRLRGAADPARPEPPGRARPATIERDRQVAARTQDDTEYLARELASVRLALADVVTNQDLDESLARIAKLIADRL